MQVQQLSFQETGRFSTLICDYLSAKKELAPFYGAFPELDNFASQMEQKKKTFSTHQRKTLVEALREQYAVLQSSKRVSENIDLLAQENTFTITTGHQLCLMTGPLYFIYKIVSSINLCEQLKVQYPKFNFVPIYWMASEDHDFEEISAFRFQDKSIKWHREAAGAVGELPLDDLQEVLNVFEQHLGSQPEANTVKDWIQASYRTSKDLSEATFRLVNQLFGDKGLVVIEPNKAKLKRLFTPILKEELTNQTSFEKVTAQIKQIQKSYNPDYVPQVNPREINLFYLTEKGRYRIEKEGEVFLLHGTEQRFSSDAFLKLLEDHPERFSPNVILRPVYQEVILPNLCYIGGGGELAYWFQLKTNFEQYNVPFPILLLRNSALMISEKQGKKIKNLELEPSELFLKRNALINKKIRQISNIDLDLGFLKTTLEKQFEHLDQLVAQTDKSFKGAVEAQKVKQINGVSHLEKRLLKAQKKVLSDQINRMVLLHEQLFPSDSLQERSFNFVTMYLAMGSAFLPTLFEALDPMNPNFILIEY